MTQEICVANNAKGAPGDVNSAGDEDARASGTYSQDLPSDSQPEPGEIRPVCPRGTKCTDRDQSHLRNEAHPFDPDYTCCCAATGVAEPEEPSLRGLFNWVDVDSSGKVSRKELEDAMPLISELWGEEIVLSEQAWEELDDDGNGHVNFSEFAEWAGPRLSLPLGVAHLFADSPGRSFVPACGIMGCPCEAFEERQSPRSPRKGRTEKKKMTWSKATSFVSTARGKERIAICKCGHKQSAHAQWSRGATEIPYPPYWSSDTSSEFDELIEVDERSLALFQDLFNATYSNIWTRDRKQHNPTAPNVPKAYKVIRAWRSENSRIWREYCVRRAMLVKDRAESPDDDTFDVYDNVKSSNAWIQHAGATAERLAKNVNEWYLFHGTNPKAARSICQNDFKMNLAGANTGTLYGRGTYFAERVTKADEYAKPDEQGEYAMLLCRALGGRVRYTDEVEPNPDELLKSCIEGPFDCILGDREKCRRTYREFVFYDTENLYAEYVIHYKRA